MMYLESIFLLSRFSNSSDSPAVHLESLVTPPYLLRIDLPSRFEPRQRLGLQSDLNRFQADIAQIETVAVDATVAISTVITNGKANCLATVPLETVRDHILPAAAVSVTSICLHQDFIWMQAPLAVVGDAAIRWRPLLNIWPEPRNIAGASLIGLAILPGLWLSYLGLSANPLHQKLLLGIELLLIGLQLFCFSLALALLIETHQSFPKVTQEIMPEMKQ